MSDARLKKLNKFRAMLYHYKFNGLTRKEAIELLELSEKLYSQAKLAEQYHNELQKYR